LNSADDNATTKRLQLSNSFHKRILHRCLKYFLPGSMTLFQHMSTKALVAASLITLSCAFAPIPSQTSTTTKLNVVGEQATSIGPAQVLRNLKETLPQIPWLAEGTPHASNKIDIPDHVAQVLAHPSAPKRVAENEERTEKIRSRAKQAAEVQ